MKGTNSEYKRQSVRKRGISMLEAVIYVALLAGLLVIAVDITLVSSNAFGKARLNRALAVEGGSALERIIREVRLAHGIDELASTFGSSPGALSLETIRGPDSETLVTRTFAIDGETLTLQEDSETPQVLTPGVSVTRLMFYKISTAATTSQSIRIEMTVEDELGPLSALQNFTGTAVLRRSY